MYEHVDGWFDSDGHARQRKRQLSSVFCQCLQVNLSLIARESETGKKCKKIKTEHKLYIRMRS